jgi:ornithine cyclodeaminase/alanine dehydrogenase-like protein (mu-crystallin family)
VPAQALLGFKAAGFWPANRRVGGEPHQATILLMDPATGRPLCVIDGNAVTTQRTGAAGALGLRQLARPDSRRLTVFGTGVQARVQQLALENARAMAVFGARPTLALPGAHHHGEQQRGGWLP